MTMAYEIHDLRDRLHHADGVATRIWRAFWEPHGAPYEQIRTGLDGLLKATTPIPFAMVAEIDGRLCGNTLVIDSDEEARPALTPWIAAVWVDEDARGQGIAAAFLEEGLRRCAALGVPKVYLSARPRMHGFYSTRGWTELERDVGKHALTLYCRSTSARGGRTSVS
jgi:GNAT superfamily N-acetyltransferase